jgi:hypothetical protein
MPEYVVNADGVPELVHQTIQKWDVPCDCGDCPDCEKPAEVIATVESVENA